MDVTSLFVLRMRCLKLRKFFKKIFFFLSFFLSFSVLGETEGFKVFSSV